MKNRVFKLLILLIFSFIPFIGTTNPILNDTESAQGNYLSAATLDFELQNSDGSVHSGLFFNEAKLKTGEKSDKTINIVKTGFLNFEYFPQFEFKNGESDVCKKLNLVTVNDGSEVYNGKLDSFDLATQSAQITGGKDEWKFSIENVNSNENLQGKNCEFNIVFSAYVNATTKTGFSDIEKLSNNTKIAYEPALELFHNTTNHTFSFKLSNLTNFTFFNYIYTYDTDIISDGGNGSETLSGGSEKTVTKLLGTCSDTCTYQANPHNFNVNINLTDVDGDHIIITKQLP